MGYSKDQFNCPVEATLFLIGGKYKPPRTIYSLTPLGRSIIPVLDALQLPKETKLLIDRYASEHIANGSRYGELTCLLGLSQRPI